MDGEQARVAAAKAALRREVLARRRAMSARQRAVAAAAVRRHLQDLPALTGRPAVAAYAALADELDLDDALDDLRRRGCDLHLPWVDGPELRLGAVADLRGLVPGWRGVREPPADGRREMAPERIDVVLVPGVAFDRGGGRLGYGGGHFDRLLARLRPDAAIVGTAFDEQLVEAVPTEPHDRRMDILVTPAGWRSARQR